MKRRVKLPEPVIKLLIVDDSALMRRQLSTLFASAGGFEIRQARTGKEAIAENISFAPDVVTLDINMPEMDGLTALSVIMTERPVPVVMVSSLTERGALATLEALNMGAVDYIPKPGGTISLSIVEIERDLIAKVRAAAQSRLRPLPATPPAARPAPRSAGSQALSRLRAAPRPGPAQKVGDGLVLIGVSTGGPRTLGEILPFLPADFPWPVLVAQHMPGAFTKSFAERLDRMCPLAVQEVVAPSPITPGQIYVARGGADMVVARRSEGLYALPRPESAQHLWHPSVELLARSALAHCPATSLVGVMLTGMGNDGADGFAEIARRGGRTIAESDETAIVYGMPRELVDRGGAKAVLPAHRIAAQLCNWAEAA
ncbi:chemotaxis-specific protein-glutamate methyltransferase CheB [Novosphingobium sp. FKTRR1]|uniref:chemotaxis-specific protein-glutamate methyltransferase CheB n=1 Tax=Novosphingobium sp. FKTRR1 TaxID=2879118 RepID=UPI001CEFF679|nr:chemotaxis-specific protein-glutamate methyltransferase CheB [Novosphingobium sp. FKTRR1]